MNTNKLKTFSAHLRQMLRKGVAYQLRYWGFDVQTGKQIENAPEAIEGGYIFRGKVGDDKNLILKWKKLQKNIQSNSLADVWEEGAYTWFNRLMAIRILEENGYEDPVLAYPPNDAQEPTILWQAKQGIFPSLPPALQPKVQQLLYDNQESEALAILLTHFCRSHKLLSLVFDQLNDFTELLVPQNLLQNDGILAFLLQNEAIQPDDYQEVELIGWLYQFYIAEKKDQVFAGFKKRQKARAQDIPAATQIFTPRWIVQYMVENTLGQLWLQQHPDSPLRQKMRYLVENDSSSSNQHLQESTENPQSPPSTHSIHQKSTENPQSPPSTHNIHQASTENPQSPPSTHSIHQKSTENPQSPPSTHSIHQKSTENPQSPPSTHSIHQASTENPQHPPSIHQAPISSLTLLDPAVGSGHILVIAFDCLMDMYLEIGQTKRHAVQQILQHHLYGLDIDRRAVQLARFAVLLKAAQHYRNILRRPLLPQIYAMPEATDFHTEELQLFLGSEGEKHLPMLRKCFIDMQQAQNIGSALQLKLPSAAHPFLQNRLSELQNSSDLQDQAIYQKLQSFLPPILMLTRQYAAVVANPPYMGGGNMNGKLKSYLTKYYPKSKHDLMTVFMEVIPKLTLQNGFFALINLPSWLFNSSFEKLRNFYLENYCIVSLLHMGRGVFGIDFGSVAFTVQKKYKKNSVGNYFRLHKRVFQHIYYHHIEELFLNSLKNKDYKYDFGLYRGEGVIEIPKESIDSGKKIHYPNILQSHFFKIPGSPIAYWVSEQEKDMYAKGNLLKQYGDPKKGIDTGENSVFLRSWYEVSNTKVSIFKGDKWYPYNKGGSYRKWYGNREHLINWENDGKELKKRSSWTKNKPIFRNKNYWFKKGFTWSKISSGDYSARLIEDGWLFDNGGSTLFSDKWLIYSGGLVNSSVANRYLEFLAPTLNFQPGDIGNILFIEPTSNKDLTLVEKIVTANVKISQLDWDSRENSWDFKNHPFLLQSVPTLSNAYQNWQKQAFEQFAQLHQNEEELNRIFIEIYGLEQELTPDVSLQDVTILRDELDYKKLPEALPPIPDEALERLKVYQETLQEVLKVEVPVQQLLSYLVGCMMGRYRLGQEGLHIAHPHPSEEELEEYSYLSLNTTAEALISIDEDAILPMMGAAGRFRDDVVAQMRELIGVVWGAKGLTDNINFINRCLSEGISRGKRSTKEYSMEEFLLKDFWTYHKKGYKKKPIYWLFRSPKGAFQVLVYMHRMDKYTLSKIRQNYLFPFMEHLSKDIEQLETKAKESSLTGSENRKLDQLRANAADCRQYEEALHSYIEKGEHLIFDLDDGVSVNYAPFVKAGLVPKL